MIATNGYKIILSSFFLAELYFQTNIKKDYSVTFPITKKDFQLPYEFKHLNITENTIILKIKEVIFETE